MKKDDIKVGVEILGHKVHDTLPSGFRVADELQSEQYEETGQIFGAAKVIFFRAPSGCVYVAVRLRPPRSFSDILHRGLVIREMQHRGWRVTLTENDEARDWYIGEYNRGWAAAARPGLCRDWDSGFSTHAFDDGYLDRAAQRMKWHLTYCTDHDNCGEG